jgi:hypothetical protein
MDTTVPDARDDASARDVAHVVARTLHDLFRALVDVGFTDAQALQLVAATVTSVTDAARLDER